MLTILDGQNVKETGPFDHNQLDKPSPFKNIGTLLVQDVKVYTVSNVE